MCLPMNLAAQYILLCCACLLLAGPLMAQDNDSTEASRPQSGFLIDTVYFQFNSAELRDDYKAELDSMIAVFTDYPAYYVEIFGHTDSVGSTAYNLVLSKKRARQVMLYLVENGVKLDRIVYEGLGTLKPVASNQTFTGRTQNRRADVSVVFSTETVAPVYPDPEPVVAQGDSVQNQGPRVQVDTMRREDYEPFFINPQKRTVILMPQGTQLTIPSGAFDTDEPEVEITIGELYSRRDMIAAQMPTLSREGTLEAAGMFSFEARAGRRTARVEDSVEFRVALPATRRDAYMRVYAGRARSLRRRRGGRNQPSLPGDTPSMGKVKRWREVDGPEVRFNGRDDQYEFTVPQPASYALARPLFYATVTDREDKGIDIEVKFRGKKPDRNAATVMVVGDVIRTYIPTRRVGRRVYAVSGAQFLGDETELVLIAYHFDDKGRAYWTKLSFEPNDFLGNKRDRRPDPRRRPKIKLKLRFRKIDPEDLNQRLKELNV